MFGCLAYVHVRAELRSKLDPNAKKCILRDIQRSKKGIDVISLWQKKIVVSRDVIFDELGNCYSPKQNVETDEHNENEDRNKPENEKDCHGNGDKAGQQSHR